ncbi:uncharacterized protein LOC141617994 [Silene latifolia]|uniref:uncharacterized protein LOC141617994 n=1 Tax=Silene latifolia TaxID=37657 RepID=UPI003D7793D5
MAFNGIGERESLWTISLGGDFNCVLTGTERLGGPVSNAEADPFQACLNTCGLTDLKATGAYYTWNNKQPPETRVYSRLDRMLLNQEWIHSFPNLFANFLPEGMFDHTPCLVSESPTLGIRKRSFKVFNIWSTTPGFLECVNTNWRNSVYGTKMYKVVRKLKLLKPVLRKINRDHFSDIENTADISHTKLIILQKEMMSNPGDMELVRQEYEANQASRVLLPPITKEEIKDIFFHIPNDKAPGPDGYSSKFFKDSWDIVGDDIIAAILDFFDTGQMLKQLNATLVTLIPKVTRPESVLQYRPIACCNVIYKCISKLICNRLEGVLSEIITPNQGGFIQGRSIMENILICQNLIKLYNRKAVSPRCLLKMDLQKAYDTIEWDFLRQLLKAIKFPKQFRIWIDHCVTTASYSLNLNGEIFGFFKGQRGLRQGDPLSPLLFTIFMDYLSRLQKYTTEDPNFRILGARKLSYGGQLVLIKAVLKTFHNYWATMFILPSGVITRIESICRNFLWEGGAEYMRSPLVAWEKLKTCGRTESMDWRQHAYSGYSGLETEPAWIKASKRLH